MRLTRCRLQDYYGKKEVNRLRMIPTEFAVILLDKADPDDYQFFTSRFLEPVGDFSNIDTSDFGQNAYLRGKIMKNRTVKLSQGSLTPSLSLSQSYETTRHQRRVFVQGRHGAQFRIVLGQEESSLSLLFREVSDCSEFVVGFAKPECRSCLCVGRSHCTCEALYRYHKA
jgi:hypothetical protein